MQCVGPGVQADENMNGAGELVDILPPNCMVKDRWKVVSEFVIKVGLWVDTFYNGEGL